jgi:hypothetical protein
MGQQHGTIRGRYGASRVVRSGCEWFLAICRFGTVYKQGRPLFRF